MQFGILTAIVFLQSRFPSLDPGCSFLFRLFFCRTLFTDGMRTGSLRMSNSGGLPSVALVLVELTWFSLNFDFSKPGI